MLGMIITIWTQRLAGSERVSNRGREVKGGLEQESGLADRKKVKCWPESEMSEDKDAGK